MLLKRIYQKLFPKIISATKEYIPGDRDEVITLMFSDNTIKKYQGSCTVWYGLPMMTRCSTFKESKLLEISKYIDKHGNPYPVSHLKKINNVAS